MLAFFHPHPPFYRRITDWISSRRGIGLQRGPRGDGEFSGKASRGNKLKTQVNGVYVFFNYVFARGKSLFRVTATLHKAVLRRFFFIGSNIQQFVESTTKVVAFFRSFFPVQSLLPVAHKVPQRLWLDSA